MKKWITRGLLTGATLLLVARAYTYSAGPPANRTGDPADHHKTCNDSGCHQDNPLNAPGGGVTLTGIPASYTPGAKYTIFVQVAKPGQSRWGFEATAMKADGSRGGEITATDQANTQVIDTENADPTPTTPQYIEHTSDGTFAGQMDAGPKISFDWIAPAQGSGPVTFYAAGNAANNDGANTGDFIYTTSVTSPEDLLLPAVVFGDLNGDGKVNVLDATLALQFAVHIKEPTAAQLAAADVAPVPGTGTRAGQKFGDGKIDIRDVTRILRRSVGLEPDPFP